MNLSMIKKSENIREFIETNDYLEMFYIFNFYSAESLKNLLNTSTTTIKKIKKEFQIDRYHKIGEEEILKDIKFKFGEKLSSDFKKLIDDVAINSEVEKRVKLKQEIQRNSVIKSMNTCGVKRVRRGKTGFIYVTEKEFLNKKGDIRRSIYGKTMDELKKRVLEYGFKWEKI